MSGVLLVRHRMRLTLLLVAAAASQAAASPPLTVTSTDGTVSVAVDADSGAMVSVSARGVALALSSGGSSMQGTISALGVTVKRVGGTVVVSQVVCKPGHDVPCTSTQALLTQTFSPRAASVGWVLNASSPVTPTSPVALWSAPLVQNVTFAEVGDKQFWAPWERGNGISYDPFRHC